MPIPKFEVVEESTSEAEIPPHVLDTLLEGVKALPRKTAQAVASCFALITVGSVFWLALLIVPYQPNTFQLIGLGGYALFVIALNVITRR